MRTTNNNHEKSLDFCAGYLLPMTIFIGAPLSIIALNSKEFPPSTTLFYVLFVLLLLAVFCVWLSAKIRFKRNILHLTSKLYYGLSLLVFIFYLVQKPFNGDYSNYGQFIFIDILIVSLVVTFSFFSLKIVKKVLLVAVLMLIVNVFHDIHILIKNNYSQISDSAKKEIPTFNASPDSAESQLFVDRPGNVYLIILDAFSGDIFPSVLSNGPNIDLEGFTYFADFSSVSWTTEKALPVFFNGVAYDGIRPLNELYEQSISAFQRQLKQRKIETTNYHMRDFTITQQTRLAAVDNDLLIVDMSFLKLLPKSLFVFLNKNYVEKRIDISQYSYGFSIVSTLLGNKEFIRSTPLLYAEQFKHMINQERELPGRGRFVFLHTQVSHGPFELNRHCEYQAPRDIPLTARLLAQDICAIRILNQLIISLKELDRFQETLIVVASDHGSLRWQPHLFIKAFGETIPRTISESSDEIRAAEKLYEKTTDINNRDMEHLPSAIVDRGVNALLLVKPVNGSGFNIEKKPRNLRQIAPTILAHFGIENTLNNYPLIFDEDSFPIEENVVQLTVHSNIPTYRYEDIFFYSKDNKHKKWQFVERKKARNVMFTSSKTRFSADRHNVDRAFDSNVNTFWEVRQPDFSSTIWAELKFDTPRTVSGYSLTTGPYGADCIERMPRKWGFLGSNDGQHWITLDRRILVAPFGNEETRVFNLNIPVEFLYYRVDIYDGFSPHNLRLTDFELH